MLPSRAIVILINTSFITHTHTHTHTHTQEMKSKLNSSLSKAGGNLSEAALNWRRKTFTVKFVSGRQCSHLTSLHNTKTEQNTISLIRSFFF